MQPHVKRKNSLSDKPNNVAQRRYYKRNKKEVIKRNKARYQQITIPREMASRVLDNRDISFKDAIEEMLKLRDETRVKETIRMRIMNQKEHEDFRMV